MKNTHQGVPWPLSVSRRRVAYVAAVTVTIAVLAGASLAAIPGPDGTINGCYDPASQPPMQLTLVDDPADCKTTLLPWAQRGPGGVLGYGVVTGPASARNSASSKSASVICPPGEVVLGGGGIITSASNRLAITRSAAASDGRRWTVRALELKPYASPWSVRARAECAIEGD